MTVRAYDPEGMEQAAKLLEGVVLPRRLAMLAGAGAAVIVTEWDAFRALDFEPHGRASCAKSCWSTCATSTIARRSRRRAWPIPVSDAGARFPLPTSFRRKLHPKRLTARIGSFNDKQQRSESLSSASARFLQFGRGPLAARRSGPN